MNETLPSTPVSALLLLPRLLFRRLLRSSTCRHSSVFNPPGTAQTWSWGHAQALLRANLLRGKSLPGGTPRAEDPSHSSPVIEEPELTGPIPRKEGRGGSQDAHLGHGDGGWPVGPCADPDWRATGSQVTNSDLRKATSLLQGSVGRPPLTAPNISPTVVTSAPRTAMSESLGLTLGPVAPALLLNTSGVSRSALGHLWPRRGAFLYGCRLPPALSWIEGSLGLLLLQRRSSGLPLPSRGLISMSIS